MDPDALARSDPGHSAELAHVGTSRPTRGFTQPRNWRARARSPLQQEPFGTGVLGQRIGRVSGACVIATAILVLTGWAFDIEVLKRGRAGLVAMNPCTAITFLVAGIALLLLTRGPQSRAARRVSTACGLLVLAVGVVKLGGHWMQWSPGFDGWLFRSKLATGDDPIVNRMAPNTALNFLLVSLAILLAQSKTRLLQSCAQLLALASVLDAVLALLGYAYGVGELYGFLASIPMALPTASTFVVLALGVLAVRCDRAPVALVMAPNIGAAMVRRLLPATVVAQVALGWAGVVLERQGFFDGVFGLALMVVFNIALISAAVCVNGTWLNRSDAARSRAEQALQRAHEELEARVRERTAELAQANESLTAKIVERRRAVNELKASEARFRSLSASSPIGIIETDSEGRYTYANDRALAILGLGLEDTLGDGWAHAVDPEKRTAILADWRSAVGAGRVYSREYRVATLEGGFRWVHARANVCRSDDGLPTGYVATLEDITGRRLAEERLREQAALLDVTQDAILVIGLDDRICYWNRGAERLYGWTSAEAVGRAVTVVVARAHSQPQEQPREAVLATGQWTGELRHVNRDGEELIVESYWTLVRDAAGRPDYVLVVDTDVTEKKKLEVQFLRSQRVEALGRLAGGIAHDLNNMLTPILMSIELLRMRCPDAGAQSLLQTLQGNAERGAAMVKQILSFARGVQGQRVPLRPDTIVAEVAKMIGHTMPKSIDITKELAENLWTVLGDETQLCQVLMNLCVNARDAMPHGGKLSITADNAVLDEHFVRMHIEARTGPYVVFAVADTGVGIPSEHLARIFDPFFTTKAQGEGTGLGLSTVLGIVKSHGGFLSVYSELGNGTRFLVYLPAAALPEATRPAEAGSLPTGQGELILVVDDEHSILDVTRGILESFGYRALTAPGGATAVELFHQHRSEIRAVLTDMMMPGVDGAATIRALRSIDPDLAVIASSGLVGQATTDAAANHGAQAFLPKPYTAGTLLTTLRQVLQN